MDHARRLPPQWVAAAPFRYHVQHLVATTGVPWQVVAMVAHLPQQQVRTLLFGRDGQRRPRVSPYAARRLFAVSREQLLMLRSERLPARLVSENISLLLDDGVAVDDLADWLGQQPETVTRLQSGVGDCSLVTSAMLRLACVERGILVEVEAKAAA